MFFAAFASKIAVNNVNVVSTRVEALVKWHGVRTCLLPWLAARLIIPLGG